MDPPRKKEEDMVSKWWLNDRVNLEERGKVRHEVIQSYRAHDADYSIHNEESIRNDC